MTIIARAVLAASALLFTLPALADDLDPASAKQLHDYTLSMDKVKAMQAAMDDFNRAAASDPGLRQQSKDTGDNSKSVAEMEAKIKASPRMYAIYQKHGLTAEDAVVMPFVLMDAGMAVQYPSAAAKLSNQMSPAQVAFYKQHQAELKKMPWLFGQ
jgi:Flp pilus assembly protein TadG